jgi:hypothetical protein
MEIPTAPNFSRIFHALQSISRPLYGISISIDPIDESLRACVASII